MIELAQIVGRLQAVLADAEATMAKVEAAHPDAYRSEDRAERLALAMEPDAFREFWAAQHVAVETRFALSSLWRHYGVGIPPLQRHENVANHVLRSAGKLS